MEEKYFHSIKVEYERRGRSLYNLLKKKISLGVYHYIYYDCCFSFVHLDNFCFISRMSFMILASMCGQLMIGPLTSSSKKLMSRSEWSSLIRVIISYALKDAQYWRSRHICSFFFEVINIVIDCHLVDYSGLYF